jgi:hypothetical protein
VKLAIALLLGVTLAGCGGGRDDRPAQPEPQPLDALIAFARAPSEATWTDVPLARTAALGLGDTVRARRSARELRDPAAWTLNVDLFRGRAGTASALELIASEDGPLRRGSGPHPHCAAGPVLPPHEAAELTRVWVQPREPDGCLDWWTVDLFLDDDGRIEVVTLDLWEP